MKITIFGANDKKNESFLRSVSPSHSTAPTKNMQYHKLLAIASVPIFNNIFCQSEANTGRKRALLRHHLSAVYEIDREIGQGNLVSSILTRSRQDSFLPVRWLW